MFMDKTIVNRFYSPTTAPAKMTFQIDFSLPTPSLRGDGLRVPMHLEAYIPAECALERFLCWLRLKNLREESYQVQGVYWLLQKELATTPWRGVKGGLLADEMGLGKTIQIVGAMMVNQLPRTLVVLPLALIDQWRTIIHNITGIPPLVFHGPGRRKLSLADLKSHKIILTTYGHIALSEGDPVTPLHLIRFNRLVFDEAHHLRNSETKKHQGARALKADTTWLLTGTPVQNHLSDFHNLARILGFSREFSRENAAKIAQSCMLRRTKESVSLDLKPVEETLCVIPWSKPEEKMLAEDIHRAFQFSTKSLQRPAHTNTPELRKNVLTALLRARQSCILPPLMKKVIESEPDVGCDSDYNLRAGLEATSKIRGVCDKILERRDNQRSKIVFTHFRGEIDAIASCLTEAHLNVGIYDGRTGPRERKALLSDTTLDVLVIQLMTGCEGLNLQHFKEIYFVSAGWNPAVEDQAIARCHRMGQDEPVSVFRFEMEPLSGGALTLDRYCGWTQEQKREKAKELV